MSTLYPMQLLRFRC